MKLIKAILLLTLGGFLLSGCEEPDDSYLGTGGTNGIVRRVVVSTDKARYNPGETVKFSLSSSANVKLRYWHLGELIEESSLNGTEWTWNTPNADNKGYMVELYDVSAQQTVGSTAVDVSSDWTRFPRYGFLSEFGQVKEDDMKSVIDFLKRCHINGIQFYDWHYDHHRPLAGTVDAPQAIWQDIRKRSIYKSTVDGYIRLGHDAGMAAMWYDLCYGALAGAENDGVDWTWLQYKDASANHDNPDLHPLDPQKFRSDIYLMDPNNSGWLNYFAGRASDVYKVFDFDGFHIDQLGSRGTRYNHEGQITYLPDGYKKFINKMHDTNPDKKLAFNAVSAYGQTEISSAPVDFLYNEVWDNNGKTPYTDLKNVIDQNHTLTGGRKKTVLAAYMNYNYRPLNRKFNTPAVLLTDAVIFALGGSHLELGEHMLCDEYFPKTQR